MTQGLPFPGITKAHHGEGKITHTHTHHHILAAQDDAPHDLVESYEIRGHQFVSQHASEAQALCSRLTPQNHEKNSMNTSHRTLAAHMMVKSTASKRCSSLLGSVLYCCGVSHSRRAPAIFTCSCWINSYTQLFGKRGVWLRRNRRHPSLCFLCRGVTPHSTTPNIYMWNYMLGSCALRFTRLYRTLLYELALPLPPIASRD